MAVKSNIIFSAQESQNFPKLMVSSQFDGLIVLFSEPKRGTVVNQGHSPYSIGRYSSSWTSGFFEDFHGKIELSSLHSG